MNMFKKEKILGEDYLVTKTELQSEEYELQMIRTLDHKDMLLCKIDYCDGVQKFCYKVSGLQSFGDFLKTHPLGSKDIINYIVQLKQAAASLESYMLDLKNIYLGEEGLYINPKNNRLKLCIIPAKENLNQINDFIRIILKNTDYNDIDALRLAFEMIKCIPETGIEINEIFRLIENCQEIKAEKIKTFKTEIISNDSIEDIDPIKYEPNIHEIYSGNKEPDIDKQMLKTSYKVNGKNKVNKSTKKTTRKDANDTKEMEGLKALIIRIFTSLAVITVGLFIYTFIKGKTAAEKIFIPYLILSVFICLYHIIGFTVETVKNRAGLAKDRDSINSECRYMLIPKNADDEKIAIRYFPFMIGSRSGITDFRLEGSEIEAVHLRIEENDEGLVFTDLNTEEGSFINGEKLNKGQEKLVLNGAEIRIGRHEYILRY